MSVPAEPPFRRIGIAGLGLIGGSIALAVRQAWPGVALLACDRVAGVGGHQAVDEVVERVEDLAGADLVVLAVPIDQLPGCLDSLARARTRAVVTDVGSTKRGVMAAARQAGLLSFVGGHPMAGGEHPGFGFAHADLFREKPWLLVRGTADRAAEAAVERFVAGVGGLARWTDAIEHDRVVAYVSHLPQVVAVALMNAADGAVGESGRASAGRAFGEMTRLASSPTDMWTAVLRENADFVREALERFVAELPASGQPPGDWAGTALPRSGSARARWRPGQPAEPR